jgi:RNA polymerase sigma-70 factor, ECF subfamily
MSFDGRSLPDLIDECLHGGASSNWENLVAKLQPTVARVAARSAARWGGTNPELIEDLTQDAFLKLCKNRFAILQQMQGMPESAALAFIKVTVANLVHDHFRSQRSSRRHPGAGFLSTDVLDQWLGETTTLDKLQRNLLLDQIDKILVRVLTGTFAKRDRWIFWLHYRHGMTARMISTIPRLELTEKGVESTLYRVGILVKHELSAGKGKSSTETYLSRRGQWGQSRADT